MNTLVKELLKEKALIERRLQAIDAYLGTYDYPKNKKVLIGESITPLGKVVTESYPKAKRINILKGQPAHTKEKPCPDCGKNYKPTTNAQPCCIECRDQRKINKILLSKEIDESIKQIPKVEEIKEVIEKVVKPLGRPPKHEKKIEQRKIKEAVQSIKDKSTPQREMKEPSHEGKITFVIPEMKSTFWIDKNMTEEEKYEFKKKKIEQFHKEKKY